MGMNVLDDEQIANLIGVACSLNEQVKNIGYLAPSERGSSQHNKLVKLLNEARPFIHIKKISEMYEELDKFYNIN